MKDVRIGDWKNRETNSYWVYITDVKMKRKIDSFAKYDHYIWKLKIFETLLLR
jgi:hypothetical protein